MFIDGESWSGDDRLQRGCRYCRVFRSVCTRWFVIYGYICELDLGPRSSLYPLLERFQSYDNSRLEISKEDRENLPSSRIALLGPTCLFTLEVHYHLLLRHIGPPFVS